MKILYIAQYYSERMRKELGLTAEYSPGGLNKILPMLSMLAKESQVTLLSTGYSRAANLRWMKRQKESVLINQQHVPVIYPAYPAVRYLSFLGIALSSFLECMRVRPEIVLFYNFRLETFGPAWLARTFTGAKIICQFEDGLHVLFGRYSVRRLVFRLLYALGKKFSDGFTLVNSAQMEEFSGKAAVVIPFVLPNEGPSPPTPEIHVLKDRKSVRVAYAGGLDKERGADIFVKAAQSLETNRRLQFYVAGKGPLLGWIQERAKRLMNLTYLGLLTEEEIDSHLKSMDILVNPQRLSHPFSRYSFPSKVMRYIMLNKPIVSTAFADISGMRVPGLHFFHHDDPSDLARVVAELADGEVEVNYRTLFAIFSEDSSQAKLAALIRRLWRRRPGAGE
jgi:glycosyltransferase involved in cell wall biosynthesis